MDVIVVAECAQIKMGSPDAYVDAAVGYGVWQRLYDHFLRSSPVEVFGTGSVGFFH